MLSLNKYNIYKFYFTASVILFGLSYVSGALNQQVTGLKKEIVLGSMAAASVLFALGVLTWLTGSRSPKSARQLAEAKANELLDIIAHSSLGPLLTEVPKGFVVRIAELIEDLDNPERRVCEDLLDELYELTPACQLPRSYGGADGCILDWYQYDLCVVAAREDMAFAEAIRNALLEWNKNCRIHLDAAEGKWAGEKEESIRKVFFAASCTCLALLSENVTTHDVRKTELQFAMNRDFLVNDETCKNYLMPIPIDEKGLAYIRVNKDYLSKYAKSVEIDQDSRHIVSKLLPLLKRSMYIGPLADIFVTPPIDGKIILPQKHFAIALSFPSERQVIVKAVAEEINKLIPDEEIFYHPNLELHLAGEDLRTTLQSFYSDQAELVAVFLCVEYVRSQWCMLEWSVILDLRSRQPRKLIPLRLDKAPIPRLPRTLAYVDSESLTPREIAERIVQRLMLNRQQQ
jgi:hypothetical protein